MTTIGSEGHGEEAVVVIYRGVTALLVLIGTAQAEGEVQTLVDLPRTISIDLGGIRGVVVLSFL